MAIAAAVLSPFVLARRWAFLGEGIAHSGFGGAGTAWLLAVPLPALNNAAAPYLFAFGFCLLTALSIGKLTRNERVSSDTAIGIFLVASLAWGFVGQHAYAAHYGRQPYGFENLLFGLLRGLTPMYVYAAVALSTAVVVTVFALFKELLAWCFDPMLAQTSGVRAGVMHYLMMVLIALVIVIGIRMMGSVLLTALLVLPAAVAQLLTRRLKWVFCIGIVVSLVATLGGILLTMLPALRWLPAGSVIVLILFGCFLCIYAGTALMSIGRRAAGRSKREPRTRGQTRVETGERPIG